MSNDLIQDVENAMREEKMRAAWKEYGPYILGGAVLAVLLTGAMTGYRSWDQRVNQRNTEMLLAAVDAPDAVAPLDAATAKLRSGQKAVAALYAAGTLAREGKTEEALKHYQTTAENQKIPTLYRGLAAWMAVRLDWSAHQDKTRAQSLIDKLKPLTADKNNPWTWHARIEAAQIAAHGLDDYKQALELLDPVLSDEAAPASLKQRAGALHHIYGLNQTKVTPTPAKEGQSG